MSDFSEIEKIQCAIVGVCPLYISNDFGAILYTITFYPFFLIIALFSVSIYINEFYLFAVSIMLTFDKALNVILKYIIKSPATFPGCGSIYSMPSMGLQHAILFETIFVTYIIIYKPMKYRLILLYTKLFTFVVIFSWIYIGFDTRLDQIIGVTIGFIEGISFQWFMYYIIGTHVHSIVNMKIFKWMYVEDNMCSHVFSDDYIFQQ